MVLINGVENAAMSPLDRGLAYGDGIFRTLPARKGAPQHWPRHYAKLAFDCAAIGLRCPDADVLSAELARVCDVEADCTIKVMVTRGVSSRGYRYDQDLEPTRIVMSTPLPDYPQRYTEAGVRVHRCRTRFAQQPALAGIKHLNRLENVLARAEWSDPDIAEGLVSDTDGNVIGGTMTNMFIVRDGVLVTSSLERCGVAGVTRDRVMQAASNHAVPCEIARVTWHDVMHADEVILVNSIAGAWPVRELEDRARSVGPLARAVQHWLKQDDEQMA